MVEHFGSAFCGIEDFFQERNRGLKSPRIFMFTSSRCFLFSVIIYK